MKNKNNKNKKAMLARILAAVLAALMVLTLLAGLIPVHSHAAKLTSAKLEELRKELDGMEEEKDKIKAEQKALRGQLSDNMSEMEKLVAEKSAIDQEIGLMNQQLLIINEQITVYGMLIADKQEELDLARQRLETLRAENKARIRAMEEQGCGYCLKLPCGNVPEATAILRQQQIPYQRVYLYRPGGKFEEMRL